HVSPKSVLPARPNGSQTSETDRSGPLKPPRCHSHDLIHVAIEAQLASDGRTRRTELLSPKVVADDSDGQTIWRLVFTGLDEPAQKGAHAKDIEVRRRHVARSDFARFCSTADADSVDENGRDFREISDVALELFKLRIRNHSSGKRQALRGRAAHEHPTQATWVVDTGRLR